jgi:hypothetical protein
MRDEEMLRVEELWTRYVAREALEPQERAALASALERDEVLRRRLVNDLQIEGALHAAGEIERGQEGIVSLVKALVTAAGRTEEVVAAIRKQLELRAAARAADTASSGITPAVQQVARPSGAAASARPRPRAFRVVVATAVVAASAAAALLLVRLGRDQTPQGAASSVAQRGTPAGGASEAPAPALPAGRVHTPPARLDRAAVFARLEAVEGPAYRHRADGTRRAAPVLDLAAGDWVSTSGQTARARLAGPGGSRIELTGDAVMSLTAEATQAAGGRMFLAQGRATAVVPPVAPGGGSLVLASPHAVVTGAGTLRMYVSTGTTRVEVREGSAHVSALGVQRGTDVAAGQYAFVRADDLTPPRAQSTVREALLLIGPDDTKEEPAPPGGLRISEDRLKNRLERLGFHVEIHEASALPQERAREADLLVMSSSVSSNSLEAWYADLPVPMMVLESTGWEQLGLSGSRWRRDVGVTRPVVEVTIENPAHPMAGGLSGAVKVLTTPQNLRWAAPPPGATHIANYPGNPDRPAVIFGYERGAATIDGPAPARRVGLFLGNGRVIRALTDAGWRLFDAAATWSVGGLPPG